MSSPKPLPLELSPQERWVLRGWSRRQTASASLMLRSKIVLACVEDASNSRVVQILGVWRAQFAAHRPDGLADQPRSGRGTRTPSRITVISY